MTDYTPKGVVIVVVVVVITQTEVATEKFPYPCRKKSRLFFL